MAAPGPVEQVLLATLHVEHSTGDGSIVAAVVEAGARELGLTAEQGAHLALAAGAVARAVYARGFDDPADAALDVTMLRLGHQVVVRIDDLGLPFNAAAEDALDMDVIEQALQGGWIDAMTHESRGRDGNRTVLVRHLDPGRRPARRPTVADAAEADAGGRRSDRRRRRARSAAWRCPTTPRPSAGSRGGPTATPTSTTSTTNPSGSRP